MRASNATPLNPIDVQQPEALQPSRLVCPGNRWQPMEEPCSGNARSSRLALRWQDCEETIILSFMRTIKTHQPVPWARLRQHLPGRSFDSIRLRWTMLWKGRAQLERKIEGRVQQDELSSKSIVGPGLEVGSRSKRQAFTDAEDKYLMAQHDLLGIKWRKIAEGLPTQHSESSVRHRCQQLIMKTRKGEREAELQMLNRDAVIKQNRVAPPGVSGPILALPRVCASDADTRFGTPVIEFMTAAPAAATGNAKIDAWLPSCTFPHSQCSICSTTIRDDQCGSLLFSASSTQRSQISLEQLCAAQSCLVDRQLTSSFRHT